MVPSPLVSRLAELADSPRPAIEDDGGTSTFEQLLARARSLVFAIDGLLGGIEPRPELISRPELGSRPDIVSRPDFSSRPEILTGPDRGSQPRLSPRPQVGSRPDFGSRPELRSRPELGSSPDGSKPVSQRPPARSRVGARVALLASPGRAWVEAFFGIALGRRVVVPLSPLHPEPELRFFLEDAEAELVLATRDLLARAKSLGLRAAAIEDLTAVTPSEALDPASCRAADVALLLYTSGTTGKPKGAMITHSNLSVQARLLAEAWGFDQGDSLLHALPLHHLHGLGISMLTALLAGARVRMLPRFDARRVWEELRSVTTWMAVPTMYQKLFEAWDAADEVTRKRWGQAAAALRLATSGSAALPTTVAERWREVTGAPPLERFGMTEIGVGMSNPLEPTERRTGYVGQPLPTVGVRIVDDTGNDVAEGTSGELWIRGPSVFEGYWRRDDATEAAFTEGWFRTGDVVERDANGYLRVLGRTSVDILKSGGYKLSALEIEEVLRQHPAVAEVAVVGVPDATWGDRVVAVIVAVAGRAAEVETEALRAWAKERLAPYKVPREVVLRDSLPRNAVGKVIKPDLVKSLTQTVAD